MLSVVKRKRRTGLRIRGIGIHREVRAAVIKFAKWLRRENDFPIRVPVYLSDQEMITGRNGKTCSALFFAPDDKTEEPFIRVSTGDYLAEKRKRGRNNALAGILCSVAHEIVHYNQWCRGQDLNERGVTRKAVRMVEAYAYEVKSPI